MRLTELFQNGKNQMSFEVFPNKKPENLGSVTKKVLQSCILLL